MSLLGIDSNELYKTIRILSIKTGKKGAKYARKRLADIARKQITDIAKEGAILPSIVPQRIKCTPMKKVAAVLGTLFVCENIINNSLNTLDFKKLDPHKTYLGLVYGHSKIAKLIQGFSQEYCPHSKAPNHVVSLINEKGDWYVYQSSENANKELGTSTGVSKVKAKDWLETIKKKNKNLELYDLPVNKSKLDRYAGSAYGWGDIVNLLKASLYNSNGKQSDSSGLICSEYMALCIDDICDFFNLPPWCITPAHFKDYLIKKQISPVY